MISKQQPFSSPEEELLEVTGNHNSLILFNDDINTFDFVIDTLIEVCGHDHLQAEQCTMIVHYKGKCDVKNGTHEKLKPLCLEMLDRGLSAEIH